MSAPPTVRPATELLAPAGDLGCALAAFAAGADGVYLGLEHFSARRGAANFTLPVLRRLRGQATATGKRLYVTINTVIRQAEVGDLLRALAELELLAVDGVIVQDLGVCRLIREHFPGLAIHASTQMAVHNAAGLAQARALGIKRVVLPRELTLADIQRLRAAEPDLELEVFVHGALCYCFSGLCLASGLIAGRSGNRGECAQICRSYFEHEGTPLYYFSCNDLCLGREVLKLRAAGVAALKIEGRMKTKEYVHHAVRLYRAILDRGDALPDADYAALLDACALTFQRRRTRGYFQTRRGEDLIGNRFPGHRGVRLGTVTEVRGGRFSLRLERELRQNDSLVFLTDIRQGGKVRFNAFEILDSNGRRQASAKAGERIFLRAGPELPAVGAEIWLVETSRFARLPETDSKTLPRHRVPLATRLVLGREQVAVGWDWHGAARSFQVPAACQAARGGRDFADIARQVFAEAGESPFAAAPLEVVNDSGFAAVFLPPSELKAIRTRFYAETERDWAETVSGRLARVADAETAVAASAALPAAVAALVAIRRQLNPPARPTRPFVTLADLAGGVGALAQWGEHVFVPLLPLALEDETRYADALDRLAAGSPERQFWVGLNNLWHLTLVPRLAAHPNVAWFADLYAYVANLPALNCLRRLAPGLRFAYYWVEGDTADAAALAAAAQPFPVVTVTDRADLPCFLSLGDFGHHNFPAGQEADGQWRLSNGARRYEVLVDQGVTYLFQAPAARAGNQGR